MTRVLRGFIFAALTAVSAFLLSGCYSTSIEDLYSLPKTLEKNVMLQNLINEEIAGGSEFSAPTRGSYRQSVQQYDIDGDGVDETFAFFLDPEKTLKICVYTGSEDSDGYTPACTISGEGTSIGSIEYADIDSDGVADLIVSWQSGTSDMRILQVFSLRGFEGTAILTVSCAEFLVSDFDGDGIFDIAVMRYNSTENDVPTGEVEIFCFADNDGSVSSSARMSRGLGQGTVTRMRTALLSDMSGALYIEGTYGDGEIITDIFVFRDGVLRNVTLSADGAVSQDTIRLNYREPYSRDIDNDRTIETPLAVPMYVQENTSGYYFLDWFSYDMNGNRTLDLSTYHSPDGWYMILTQDWRESLTVRRSDGAAGERAIVLSTYDGESGEVRDFLTVYTLTGDNRRDRARLPGRFILHQDDTTIYAVRIFTDMSEWEYVQTVEEIKSNFKLIYPEWTTGAIN